MELAFALTWTEYRAADLVQTALSTVDKTPAMLTAMLNGRRRPGQGRVVGDELAEVDDVAQARAIVERLLPELGRVTTAQLRLRVRRLVLSVHPDKVRTRHTKTVAQRSGGASGVRQRHRQPVRLVPAKDKAAAAWDHIDAIARATRTAGDPAGRGIDAIRADVFADLLAGVDPTLAGAATPAPRKGVIHLTVGLTTLAGWTTNPPTSPASDPSRPTWPAHPDGHHRPLALRRHRRRRRLAAEGRLRYRPTAAQTAFIRARDRTCRAPGCRKPAMVCHIDHNQDWANGGPTLITNLCNLCAAHHGGKHQGGYRLRRGPHGMRWITPRARHYTVLGEDHPRPTPLEHTPADISHRPPKPPPALTKGAAAPSTARASARPTSLGTTVLTGRSGGACLVGCRCPAVDQVHGFGGGPRRQEGAGARTGGGGGKGAEGAAVRRDGVCPITPAGPNAIGRARSGRRGE
jgi:hypothetical protein